MKQKNKQEATINRQGSSERERDSAGVGGDTVIDNAVNYSDSGARERI